jgi:hypothetical protein
MDEVKKIVRSAFSKLADKKDYELIEIKKKITALKKAKSEIDICLTSPLLITVLNKTIESHEEYAKYLNEWSILVIGISMSLSCCWINKYTPVYDTNKAIVFCDELIDLELNDKSDKEVSKKETKHLNVLKKLRSKLFKLQKNIDQAKTISDIDETKI